MPRILITGVNIVFLEVDDLFNSKVGKPGSRQIFDEAQGNIVVGQLDQLAYGNAGKTLGNAAGKRGGYIVVSSLDNIAQCNRAEILEGLNQLKVNIVIFELDQVVDGQRRQAQSPQALQVFRIDVVLSELDDLTG